MGGASTGVAEIVTPSETSVAPFVREQTRNEYCVLVVSPVTVAEVVALVIVLPCQHVAGAVAPAW